MPFGPEVIEAARRGRWEVLLTNGKPVPRAWFPEMEGADVLCLASGGGQQAPVLAAGAGVTVFDNSPAQLAQDRLVAGRESLELQPVRGDMRGLSAFSEGSFDLAFHPVLNLFVPEVRPVWAEALRVLRRGGALLAGFPGGFPQPGQLHLRPGSRGHHRRAAGQVRASLLRRNEFGRRRVGGPDRAGRAARVRPHSGGSDRRADRRGVLDLRPLRGPPSRRPDRGLHANLRRHTGDKAMRREPWPNR